MSLHWKIGACVGGCALALGIVSLVLIDRGLFDPSEALAADAGLVASSDALQTHDSTPTTGDRAANRAAVTDRTGNAMGSMGPAGTLTGGGGLFPIAQGPQMLLAEFNSPTGRPPGDSAARPAGEGFSVWPQKP